MVRPSDGKNAPSGELEINLHRRELRLKGSLAPIGGRAFDVLHALVEASGDVVAKSELMERIWPDAFVGDNALQMHIFAIRKALGPDRDLLKTISAHGYRLLGEWTVRTASNSGESPSPLSQTTNRSLGDAACGFSRWNAGDNWLRPATNLHVGWMHNRLGVTRVAYSRRPGSDRRARFRHHGDPPAGCKRGSEQGRFAHKRLVGNARQRLSH